MRSYADTTVAGRLRHEPCPHHSCRSFTHPIELARHLLSLAPRRLKLPPRSTDKVQTGDLHSVQLTAGNDPRQWSRRSWIASLVASACSRPR